MPLNHEDRLNKLLRLWDERRREGEYLSAETLCHDCPELKDEVRRRITEAQADSEEALGKAPTVPESPAPDRIDGNGTPPPTISGPNPPGETPPPRIPGYTILSELGRGGMGVVYKAHQVLADRLVALKVLLPEYASDAAMRERFRKEPQSQAKFQHANIV